MQGARHCKGGKSEQRRGHKLAADSRHSNADAALVVPCMALPLTCRHCTAVGRLLGSHWHIAVMRSQASGQAWGMSLLKEVGANCTEQQQQQQHI